VRDEAKNYAQKRATKPRLSVAHSSYIQHAQLNCFCRLFASFGAEY